MRVDLFDFDLPPERIALRPASPRDAARLLTVDALGMADRAMRDLPGLLRAGDVLLALDGVTLDSTNTLTRVLDRHYPGDVLDLTWVDSTGVPRDGKAVLTP